MVGYRGGRNPGPPPNRFFAFSGPMRAACVGLDSTKRSENIGLIAMGAFAFAGTFAAGSAYMAMKKPAVAQPQVAAAAQAQPQPHGAARRGREAEFRALRPAPGRLADLHVARWHDLYFPSRPNPGEPDAAVTGRQSDEQRARPFRRWVPSSVRASARPDRGRCAFPRAADRVSPLRRPGWGMIFSENRYPFLGSCPDAAHSLRRAAGLERQGRARPASPSTPLTAGATGTSAPTTRSRSRKSSATSRRRPPNSTRCAAISSRARSTTKRC